MVNTKPTRVASNHNRPPPSNHEVTVGRFTKSIGGTVWRQLTPGPHVIELEDCDQIAANKAQLSHEMVDKIQREK